MEATFVREIQSAWPDQTKILFTVRGLDDTYGNEYVLVSAVDIGDFKETVIYASNRTGHFIGDGPLHEYHGVYDVAEAMRRAGYTIMV